ncbi:hypothetical protein D9M73_51650 [compost metagenome]|uniref:Chromosome partition protein MukF n=1 Tax=Polaromonas aquatica TaxID=332657 RepID=A0ABW1TX51_9BURK
MSSPIKDVLKTLHHNAEVVEQALHGVINSEGTSSNPSITALRQASALRPAGEDGYRLHPRLREYLHDHLQLFPAFQSLAEIGSRISQVNNLWMEVDDIRRSADTETVNTIVDTIQTTVFDIADSVDRNMLFLQTLMSTRYGNVRSLEAKKSQNRFYQQQTNTLADDLTRLSKVCDKVEREASTRGLEDLARFIRRNLLSRILVWQQSMSEMQTHLSKEIYRMREVERNHKLLARMDMLLRQQPGWRGFEADLRGEIPDFLMAASLPAIAAHVEPLDTDTQIFDEMQKQAAALPAKQVEPELQEVKRYTRVIDPPYEQKLSDAAIALERLVQAVQTSPSEMSLMEWRLTDDKAQSVEPHVWLVFAVMGLRGLKLPVSLVNNGARAGERFAHSFGDAIAHPAPAARAQA